MQWNQTKTHLLTEPKILCLKVWSNIGLMSSKGYKRNLSKILWNAKKLNNWKKWTLTHICISLKLFRGWGIVFPFLRFFDTL